MSDIFPGEVAKTHTILINQYESELLKEFLNEYGVSAAQVLNPLLNFAVTWDEQYLSTYLRTYTPKRTRVNTFVSPTRMVTVNTDVSMFLRSDNADAYTVNNVVNSNINNSVKTTVNEVTKPAPNKRTSKTTYVKPIVDGTGQDNTQFSYQSGSVSEMGSLQKCRTDKRDVVASFGDLTSSDGIAIKGNAASLILLGQKK